jgi:Flp pilus assembly protein TadD
MNSEDALGELGRVLAGRVFRGSDRTETQGRRARAAPQSAALLRFLVMRALDEKPISDAIVTQEFFQREPQTFDRGQAIARVHVGILRKKLTEYYVTDGIDDPVSIDIPVGTMVPVFTARKTSPPDKELERGLHQINLEAPVHVARAIAHFEESIRLRPENSEAWAGIAMALSTRTLHDISADPAQLLPRAEEAARKALSFSAGSWRAHAALGGIHIFRRQWQPADAEFRKALAIDARGTTDHGAYGLYVLGRGDYKVGRDLAKRYEEDYPADVTFLKRAALYRYAMREFAAASRILDALFELEENLWHAHHLRSLITLAQDRPGEALSHVREIAHLKDPSLWPGLHILCLARAGHREEAADRFPN